MNEEIEDLRLDIDDLRPAPKLPAAEIQNMIRESEAHAASNVGIRGKGILQPITRKNQDVLKDIATGM